MSDPERVTDEEREKICEYVEAIAHEETILTKLKLDAGGLLRTLQHRYRLGPTDEIESYTGIIRRKG